MREDGAVAVSAYRCEACARCFASVDKLDRHRLRCLPTGPGLPGEAVVVRSLKAFSGFEGVVASSQKDKWEVPPTPTRTRARALTLP